MTSRNTVLLAVALILAVLFAAEPARTQGMYSAPETAEFAPGLDQAVLAQLQPQEINTIQRLLRRLGLLSDENMTRKLDEPTLLALSAHLNRTRTPTAGLTGEKILRSLFTTVWIKGGWGAGTVNGQEIVVDRAELRAAQQALTKLGYAPGPVDGVYGPATFSAIEIFQEDNGLKVSGLLTRNTQQNITLAMNFANAPAASTVRVLNWPDYISPDMLTAFEKDSNIRIVHEVFDSTTETKDLLLQGSDKYDLMVQSGSQMRQVLEKKNAVVALDRGKLPNAKYLDPATLEFTGVLDPGNVHSVPYMWGTVGLAVNKDKVKAIKPDAPLDSMALILDPAIAADLAQCGIGIIDEPIDVIPALVAYLGGDIRGIGITDLEAVGERLAKVAPYVTLIPLDSYIDDVANGKYCVAFGYSGDTFAARDKAKENKKGALSYIVPKDGSLLWFDLFVIPAASANKDGAYRLIDYMLKPEVAAANTNFLQYANPVAASTPYINKELLKDPGLYPPKNVVKRLAMLPPLPVEVEAELQRIWAKLKKE